MITEPRIERRRRQNYVAIRIAVPIPFGKYLQPAWDEVYDWMMQKDGQPITLSKKIQRSSRRNLRSFSNE